MYYLPFIAIALLILWQIHKVDLKLITVALFFVLYPAINPAIYDLFEFDSITQSLNLSIQSRETFEFAIALYLLFAFFFELWLLIRG